MSHHQWIDGTIPRIVNTSIDIDAANQTSETATPEWELPQWLDISFLSRLDALNTLPQPAGERSQQAASESQTLIAETIAAFTHEVRTPLSTIRATLEVIGDDTTLDSRDVQQLVGRLQRSVTWITELVDNLSTRVEACDGVMTLDNELVNVRDWLEQAIALVQPIADQRGQSILLATPRPSPVVYGDIFWLRQVMVNLLTNACRYGAWADTIAVSVSANDGFVLIRVSDHGIGVLPEERDRIFERLVRGTQSGDQEIYGQGLGLHIVRDIVERHAGTISVESTVGQGSTFSVRLPTTHTTWPPLGRHPAIERRGKSR